MTDIILAVVAEYFGVDKVHEQDHLVNDLGADELDVIEMVMTLEENFNIEISDDEAEAMRTVQDVIDCVRAKELSNV